MSNYLKTCITKALTLALAFTVATGFMFVINTKDSYAEDRNELNSAELTLDIPKCGTPITKINSWTSDPEPNLEPAEATPKYWVYNPYWCTEDGERYSGVVTGDSPLYLNLWLAAYYAMSDENDYYWANDNHEEEFAKYTGTLKINGKPVETVSGIETEYYGAYISAIVKFMPEHDWDEGKVSGDTKTYTCEGCGAIKTEKVPSASSTPMLAKMTSKGAKAMNFTWSKVAGAEGYDIYLSKCNHGGNKYTPQLVKSITGNKTAKWTKKGLKKNIPYKGYVKAYKMENGKKTYIGESLEMHAYTNGGNKKYTNAKSVSVKKTSVSLAAGKTHKIKASVKKLKAGKALPGKTHTAKLRYFSSNTSVATVSGNGTITAKAAGKCKVYAVAANGARKAVTVTVK